MVKGVIELLTSTTGENGEFRLFGHTAQAGIGQEPLLPRDVTLAVFTPVKFHEFPLHLFVSVFAAEGLNPSCRKFPIIIEPGAILPAVKLRTRDPLAGKKLYCFERGAME